MNLTWLDADSRAEAYQFYHQFMPYARLTKKELLGVFFAGNLSEKKIIAAVRLRPIGEYQLLTGMLVHPEYRGQGLAHQLMFNLQRTLNTKPSFLFSLPELTSFYQQHRFFENSEITMEQSPKIPAEITQLYKRYVSKGKQLYLMQYQP
ncbi:GNAT family N-acetyltransferase [Shewanella mesophila]|uniref:GNAT family N-acetyltransferase n=1 Tax=Shewanella mesophila TaxID=2864208 RepID=UPI001C661C03|nr:GNAT family N-acetyltransferase [Shewanella mesophila]QYJ85191.1 GNAT family N-acetyltransferase [Shewanella mesophila]